MLGKNVVFGGRFENTYTPILLKVEMIESEIMQRQFYIKHSPSNKNPMLQKENLIRLSINNIHRTKFFYIMTKS